VGPAGRISGHLGLAERLEVEAAIDAAFEPLRARRAGVGPARVRAAVRWGRGTAPVPVPWAAAIARLSELGVAVGMSAFIFTASLGSIPVRDGAVPATVSDAIVSEGIAVPRVTKPLEDERYIRWLKLDRPVPMEDRLDPSMLPRAASALDLDADGTTILLRSLILR
jgi:hypothetical protein